MTVYVIHSAKHSGLSDLHQLQAMKRITLYIFLMETSLITWVKQNL